MGKILEKLMKKYWKNAKNTGKVDEKILEKCKKNWNSQGNSSVQKSENHVNVSQFDQIMCHCFDFNDFNECYDRFLMFTKHETMILMCSVRN